VEAGFREKIMLATREQPGVINVDDRRVNQRLTITSRALLKRNYNWMNQAFLAIVVKIRAPKFTIPTRFADLL
jgi:hypothetical protein